MNKEFIKYLEARIANHAKEETAPTTPIQFMNYWYGKRAEAEVILAMYRHLEGRNDLDRLGNIQRTQS